MKYEKYNLNEETYNFILSFESKVEKDKTFTNKDLVKLFEESTFYNYIVLSYYPTAIQKSIWWAVKRSKRWSMKRGEYTKL